MIGKFEMTRSNGERHILGVLKEAEEYPERTAEQCFKWIAYMKEMVNLHNSPDSFFRTNNESCINVVWWDKKPNFGDAIGPWLVSKVTGKDPVNGLGLNLPSPPIMTVGSILNLIDQDNTVVWGTGLMGTLSEASASQLRRFKGISVRSVRGKLTRDELVAKLGWEVAEVYGDPALLLPKFLPKPERNDDAETIAIVPHYMHMDYFKKLESSTVQVLDVKDGMERIVRQIASARVCISTSLHGLIIAQAYGIPWVWVRISDHRLGGDTFKFKDFFTTLDDSAVSSVDVAVADVGKMDMEAVAETATIPELRISLDALLQSFPSAAQQPAPIAELNSRDASKQVTEGPDSSEDLTGHVESLLNKLDSIADELAEQRRLLEKLVGAR